MATTAAIIGLRVPGVEIENIETTAKTIPDFTGLWTSIVA
jgi:3-phosphoshikimate 1-carboxyvinyltransferase